jgi:hypothetical protein
MEQIKSNELVIPIKGLSLLGILLEGIMGNLVEKLLGRYIGPMIDYLNSYGIIQIFLSLSIYILLCLIKKYSGRDVKVKLSPRNAAILGILIVMMIPFVFIAYNLKSGSISNPNTIMTWMVLTALGAWISPSVPNSRTAIKSILVAIPAISLGVAVGFTGMVLVENYVNYGTPCPDAYLILNDHIGTMSQSTHIPAMTYSIQRDTKKVLVSIPFAPIKKSIPLPSEDKLVFDGRTIPPDGITRPFSLEGGKNYIAEIYQ